MPLSAVDKARLLESGDVEVSLVMPNVKKGVQVVIAAVVTQDSVGRGDTPALAHTSHVFTPAEDDQVAVFTVPRDPGSGPFDPKVGIEARATASWTCWSALDGAGAAAATDGWTWIISDWG
jgi:hypothetical protein